MLVNSGKLINELFIHAFFLNDNLGLESILKHLKLPSERYFDKAADHDNRLMVATAATSARAVANHRRFMMI